MTDFRGPLSHLYGAAAQFKNFLYDHHYLQQVGLPIPVISVGNLTMGGTGKTPVTDFCLRLVQQNNRKIAVVSRNYRSQIRDIGRVDLSTPDAAAFFGDEPVLLARRNPGVDFFVGPSKSKTAQYVVEEYKPDLLVVDDGFQHRALERDLDLVVFDATEKMRHYECVPRGRGREPWSALQRATAFVVTKVNLAEPGNHQELLQRLEVWKKPIFTMSYENHRLRRDFSGDGQAVKDFKGQGAYLVSGIAKPASFERGLAREGLEILSHRIFRDHHPYSSGDIAELVREWKTLGKPPMVTTEKDFVKLQPLWPDEVPLWMAPLEVKLLSKEDLFYETLDQALR